MAMRKDTATSPNDCANAVRFTALVSFLFGVENLSNIEVLFARDWKINKQPFRTTWLSGWWLERVMALNRMHDG